LPTYAITGILVLPLLLAPAFHAQPLDWIQKPTLVNLGATFVVLSGDFVPLAALYFGILTTFLVGLWKQRSNWRRALEAWNYTYVLAGVVVPVVLAFTYSLVAKPLYTSPYFLVCVVPFTLLVAACIESLRRKWLRWALIGAAVVLAGIRLVGWYTGSHVLTAALTNNSESWGKTATYLAQQSSKNDAVLYYPSMDHDKVDYYLDKQKQTLEAQEVVLEPYFLTTGRQIHTLDVATLEALPATHKRVWLVLERVDGKEAARDTATIENFMKSHYKLQHIEHFDWLEINKYELAE
jgi:hypothetical protein